MISSQRLLWQASVFLILLGSPYATAWSTPRMTSTNHEVTRREVFGMSAASSSTGLLFLLLLKDPLPVSAYTPDTDKLRESLYLVSRVQEATVQQERFVGSSLMQEDLKKKMKLTLRLVEKNYLLLDQINLSSSFVQPADGIIDAVEAGNEAVDSLQAAIDYVNNDLSVGPMTDEQRSYLTSNLMDCREKLFVFLKYMPQEKLLQARERVEYENVKNREEYAGSSDDGLFNPVKLPWQ